MSPLANSSAAAAPQRAPLEAVTPPEPSRRRWWAAVVLVLVVAGGAWFLRPQPQSKASAAAVIRTVRPVRGSLQSTVRLTGSVIARNFSNIFVPLAQAPETGRGLTLIYLPSNGSMVKEGDVVAEID